MVSAFPYEIPEEFATRPLLKGRARVEMKVKVVDNPNVKNITFELVVDGYNAPVTGGNFVDLVERRFYDGMDIQRGDNRGGAAGEFSGLIRLFIQHAHACTCVCTHTCVVIYTYLGACVCMSTHMRIRIHIDTSEAGDSVRKRR